MEYRLGPGASIAITTSRKKIPNSDLSRTRASVFSDVGAHTEDELELGEDAFEPGVGVEEVMIKKEDVMMEDDLDEGYVELRGKTNTPISCFSGLSDFKTSNNGSPSPAGRRFDSPSKDSVFQQAINLMSERCPSMALMRKETAPESSMLAERTLPYGAQHPSYFYVKQNQPSPMEPLKAWRGYNGNVYFEPIQIGQAKCLPDDTKTRTITPGFSAPTPQASPEPMRVVRSRNADSRTSVSSAKSGTSKSFDFKGRRQMSIFDKKTVFLEENERLHEDWAWVIGTEAMGSLRVQPMKPQTPAGSRSATSSRGVCQHQRDNKITFDREKIRKGSVARKVHSSRNNMTPILTVTGDKYTHPQLPSPLLRSQTQYSQSSQRVTMNSPDLFHNFTSFDKLPPLEQLRASLKHMDHVAGQDGPMVHIVPNADKLKMGGSQTLEQPKHSPLVKFGPGVTTRSNSTDGIVTQAVRHQHNRRSKVK